MIPIVIVRGRQQLKKVITSATRAGGLCGQLVFASLVQLSFLSAEDCSAPRTSSFRQNTTSARHRSDWGQPRAGSLVTRWLAREMGAEIVWTYYRDRNTTRGLCSRDKLGKFITYIFFSHKLKLVSYNII